MTVFAVTCECGGTTNLVRKVFRRAGLTNWLDIPIFRGDSGIKALDDDLMDWVKELDGYKILKTRLSHGGTYAIVVGFDRNEMMWADVKNGSIEDGLRAENIASEFA